VAVNLSNPDATIHQGAVAPYALRYTVTSADADFDLSTPTAGAFEIQRESGDTDTWTVQLSAKTATSLLMTYVFQVGDLPKHETLVVEPRLDTPGGEFVCEPKVLLVKKPFT
jgi:hypothetical protein